CGETLCGHLQNQLSDCWRFRTHHRAVYPVNTELGPECSLIHSVFGEVLQSLHVSYDISIQRRRGSPVDCL
ncbi:hypothetical protein JOQ06_023071, partial [Pogonophryne albipinna]